MLPRPLPPPQRGGGVWLRTRTGYGAAWRPHLLEKPRPLPPPQKGGGVWLRTQTGYGAAWRPHLLEKPRPLPHPQRGGGVEGGCSVFVGLCPTLGYVAPLGLAMVAQKKEISKCLFLFLCYYNIIILQYNTI